MDPVHGGGPCFVLSLLYASHFHFKIVTSANFRQTGRKNKEQSEAEIDYD